MAQAPLSILLRDGTHAGASIRLALKTDQFSIQIAKTPLQIAVSHSTPLLLDMGMTRPSINISGLVDNIGGDTSNNTANFWDMESMVISGPNAAGDGTENQTYYVPYKNYLESKLVTWVTSEAVILQVEIGDATTADGTSSAASTGGGIYEVAVQQAQFNVAPAMEDRWMFTISLVAKLRNGISF